MSGKLLVGPWPVSPLQLEGVAFTSLSPERQQTTLAYALHDLRRYLTDLRLDELDTLRDQLPAARPLRVVDLTAEQRASLAAALLPLLRRRAGWAA